MIKTTMPGINELSVVKFKGAASMTSEDIISIEEPLEIQLEYGPFSNRTIRSLAVTMRTPGNDEELAVGFLFTEGIIQVEYVLAVVHESTFCTEQKQNIIIVKLDDSSSPVLQHAERNFYTTSSCGVCGKSSIAAIRTVSIFNNSVEPYLMVNKDILYELPGRLRQEQDNFSATGGIHAAGLFSAGGELLLLREDVGRHNALDKVIGRAFAAEIMPLNQHILVLSGRASFELIQKAAMAGIRIIAAMGAPSSLAVELALEFNITLIGFLSNKRFNIYTSGYRIF
jgi:FdhD protein